MAEAVAIIAFAVCAFFFEKNISRMDDNARFEQAVQYEREQMRDELIKAGIDPAVMNEQQQQQVGE